MAELGNPWRLLERESTSTMWTPRGHLSEQNVPQKGNFTRFTWPPSHIVVQYILLDAGLV